MNRLCPRCEKDRLAAPWHALCARCWHDPDVTTERAQALARLRGGEGNRDDYLVAERLGVSHRELREIARARLASTPTRTYPLPPIADHDPLVLDHNHTDHRARPSTCDLCDAQVQAMDAVSEQYPEGWL